MARHSMNFADIVVFSYQYIIDPKISDLVTKDFGENSIIVFDEAHNIGKLFDYYFLIAVQIMFVLTP
jgi:Rad3-related DNA helicase